MKVIAEIRRRLRPLKRAYKWLWRVLALVPYARVNYIFALRRYRRKKGKVRVLFLLNELSKWKMQKLFDLMASSNDFEPVIALTYADVDWSLSQQEKIDKHKKMREYFALRGIDVVESFSLEQMKPRPISKFDVDVVFYQQPWGYHIDQFPAVISRHAITCYVPYFVPNYSYLPMECYPFFLSTLFRYYTLSQTWEKYLSSAMNWFERTTRYVGSGHPALDLFVDGGKGIEQNGKCVIYAPHWSVNHPENVNSERYSTFLENGDAILRFAKEHREIKWIFKPHPSLRVTLESRGIWPMERTAEYWSEWERLGMACYDADYQKYFWMSSAIVTDCASFLCEYSATGKPVIRLVSHAAGIRPSSINQALFDSFYNVENLDEMERVFNDVIVNGNDPKRDVRLKAASDFGLMNFHASESILNDLRAMRRCV